MAEDTLNPVGPNEAPPQPLSVQPPRPIAPRPLVAGPVTPELPVQEDVPLSSAVVMPSAEAKGAAGLEAIQKNTITYSDTNLEAISKYASSLKATAAAAASQWTGVGIYEKAIMPKFVPEDGFDLAGRIGAVKFQLNPEEEKFLQSSSNAEFDYKMGLIEQNRGAQEKLGNHPVLGFLVGALDPAQIAIDIASAGVGRAFSVSRGVGRVIAGSTAVGLTAGLGVLEQEGKPISDSEIVTNALINGAAAGLFYGKGPAGTKGLSTPDPIYKELADAIAGNDIKVESRGAKWVPTTDVNGTMVVDPTTGKPILRKVADDVAVQDTKIAAKQIPDVIDETGNIKVGDIVKVKIGTTVDAAGNVVKKMDVPDGVPTFVTPPAKMTADQRAATKLPPTGTARSELAAVVSKATDPSVRSFAEQLLNRIGSIADDMKVVRDASIKRSFFDFSTNTVYLRGSADDRIVTHEFAHATTFYKIHYGMRNPDTVHGQIVKEIDNLRKQARKGLKSLDKESQYYLSNMDEFAAGLYSGHAPFVQHLAKLRDANAAGNISILSAFVDSVRRLLGFDSNATNGFIKALNLVEKLQDQPLHVKMMNKNAGAKELLQEMPSEVMPQSKTASIVSKQLDSMWHSLGKKISWSLSKTMDAIDPMISKLLVDDPLVKSGESAASFQRSIRADLAAHQYKYEDALRAEMATRGAGSLSQIATAAKAMRIQAAIEKEVQVEMLARQERARLGMDLKSPGMKETPITKMADHLQDVANASLKELKAAGVPGADALDIVSGYFSRQWNPAKLSDAMNAFKNTGLDDAGAKAAVRDLMMQGIQRANGWDDKLSRNVASAIVDRTLRKGELSDNAFRGHIGNAGVAELRDDLARLGIEGKDAQDILDKMTGRADEANKASFLKHKVEMDTSVSTTLDNGVTITLSDLIDSNLSNITERYLDNVAGRSAMSRVGLKTESDVAKMRTAFVEKAGSQADKKAAAELFDNVIDAIMGRPLGKDMHDAWRFMQSATQMVGLGMSGVWQVTEYAAIFQKFGLTKALGYFMSEMPLFRNLFDSALNKQDSVASILTRNSFQDIRLRPFISKLEDNFEIDPSSHVMFTMQQAKQWVPYLNGMRVVHHHQARMTGNLIADTLVRGANGDTAALKALEKYGLDQQLMDKVRADIKLHGQDTSKWSEGSWDAIRNPLNRMVDDAVLRSRTGEIPAFAQFSEVGKFVFTFRSFVLAAHNKILAGTLSRDGLAGISLLLAYQFPLTLAAVQAENTMRGKPKMKDEDWVKRAIAQMGGLGMFTEIFGAVAGDKTKFGAPGTLILDKAYNVLNSVGRGDANGTANALVGATPILAIVPGIKALTEALVPPDKNK